MNARVFIDGEAGTTGLQIHARLKDRRDIELLSIDPARRKDPDARAERLNSADLVILCLPDDAAREAVSLIENPKVKVIDASTAHRVAPDWVFGFPEMAPGQRKAIASAKRVSNPGCWSTGAIALIRPLVKAEVVPANWPFSIHGVSGYSGGGKAMIAEFEDEASPTYTQVPYRLYAMGLEHKHLPEIAVHADLARRPIFSPAVGRYLKGMLVEVPLPLEIFAGAPTLQKVHAVLAEAYAGQEFVDVASLEDAAALKTLDPEGLNGTNLMRLYVFGNAEHREARLVALLDNLGKGASGAAVQNMNLMLGLPEDAGL
jgi:N-acetyl-gamma-glutamyl-phosphate reductase